MQDRQKENEVKVDSETQDIKENTGEEIKAAEKKAYVPNSTFEAYVAGGASLFLVSATNYLVGCSGLVTGLSMTLGLYSLAMGSSQNGSENTIAYVSGKTQDFTKAVKESPNANYYYNAVSTNANSLFNAGKAKLTNVVNTVTGNNPTPETFRKKTY